MVTFNRFLIIQSSIFLLISFVSCQVTKGKISNDIAIEKLDSLPLIPKHFFYLQRASNGACIAKGNTNKKLVALTFDDGPTNFTDKILDVLIKNKAKATFFWLGKNLAGKAAIIDKAKLHGNQIANHSWDHTNCYGLDENTMWEKQVLKTFNELENVAGVNSKYYRPPFGGVSQKQIDFLGSKGITTVPWSLTTMDWDKKQNSAIELETKFKNFLHPGAIVLMHDFNFAKDDDLIIAIEKMIIYGKSQGYTFVTVDKMK